jgi:predicted transcriptional regulator
MSGFSRVTVTVPTAVLKAADRLAARLDRSRSWVVAEALRRYAAQPEAVGAVPGAGEHAFAAPAVREPPTPPYELRSAFRAAEAARLESDLALTPEQRVHVAEEIARTSPSDRPRPRFRRVLQFDTYADYLDWKRYASLEP